MDNLNSAHKLIGLKQSIKALEQGRVERMYLALDAEECVLRPLLEKAKPTGIDVMYVDSMQVLGRACSIDVGASVVVILK